MTSSPALMVSVLDAIGVAALVTDCGRRTTRETSGLAAILGPEPEAHSVRSALTGLLAELPAHACTSRPLTRAIRTRRASYALGAMKVGEPGVGTVAVAWVIRAENAGERLGVQPFRLTPREREVARSIALGASSREIAGVLGISVHTARRHTERVFEKLGVRTRASVAAVLLAPRP